MNKPVNSIVFSLERGEVWASWYGDRESVLLGQEDHASEMMADFLAQRNLGKRFNSSDPDA